MVLLVSPKETNMPSSLLFLFRFCPPVIDGIMRGCYHIAHTLLIWFPKHPNTGAYAFRAIIKSRKNVCMYVRNSLFFFFRLFLRFLQHSILSLRSQRRFVLPSDPAIHASAFFCGNSRSFLYVHFLNAFRKPDRCFRNRIVTLLLSYAVKIPQNSFCFSIGR